MEQSINDKNERFNLLKNRWKNIVDTFNYHSDMALVQAKEMNKINKELYKLEITLNKDRDESN